MAAARKRGVILGRPRKLSEAQIQEARLRLEVEPDALDLIAKDYGVSPKTITRALLRMGKDKKV